MRHPIRAARIVAALALITAICLALAARGGGGSTDASTLLRETFGAPHYVGSGELNFAVTVTPGGSRTVPIRFSFGGPFQSRGKGELPASDFQISLVAQGVSGSLRLLSTGTQGYVTLGGASYELPAATFQQLESSFAQLTTSSGGGSGSTGGTDASSGSAPSALARLGIDPMHWLVNPSVVGSQRIGDAETTQIRAGVNVPALLSDLNAFLLKASARGVSGAGTLPHGISATAQSKIASEVRSPTVQIWTGKSDKTIRRLALELTLSGYGSDGPGSAAIGVVLQYANLNQPQAISAPPAAAPFTQLSAKVRPVLQQLESGLAAGLGSAAENSGAARSGSAQSVKAYNQCISAAASNSARIRRCGALLNRK